MDSKSGSDLMFSGHTHDKEMGHIDEMSFVVSEKGY
jgi:hypothetical protein